MFSILRDCLSLVFLSFRFIIAGSALDHAFLSFFFDQVFLLFYNAQLYLSARQNWCRCLQHCLYLEYYFCLHLLYISICYIRTCPWRDPATRELAARETTITSIFTSSASSILSLASSSTCNSSS